MVRTSACWVLAAFATGAAAQGATTVAASSTVSVIPAATTLSSVSIVPPGAVNLALTTTTYTPWDSSASLSGDSDFLQSSNSDSLHDPASSGSDPSGSLASSASTASGSSGSFLELWQWGLLMALACCCGGGILGALTMGKKKKKPSKKTSAKKPQPVAQPAPAPAPAAVAEPAAEFLLPPIMPMPTASPLMPSYSMAAPVTYAATPEYTYAAQAGFPGTTSYAATPQYAYAQPEFLQAGYAPGFAPATTSMAAPAYNYAAVPAAATYASQFPRPAM